MICEAHNIKNWLAFILVFFLFSCSNLNRAGKSGNENIGIDLTKDSTYSRPSYEYFDANFLHYNDFVHRDLIKTVQLHPFGLETAGPYLNLSSGDKLLLSFDDLEGGVKDYFYSIQHCNADWQSSALLTYDYIEGFEYGKIYEYQFSFNTNQEYTHYLLEFPNMDFKITKSGNYILKVYLDNNTRDPVLTRRFMAFYEKVEIFGAVRQPFSPKLRKTRHLIQFTTSLSSYQVQNPFRDIKVIILQNNRWDNAISSFKPRIVLQDELTFDSQDDGLFEAGNEFRYFDTRSKTFHSERVYEIISSDTFQYILYPDEIRSFKQYMNRRDINGHYIVETKEGTNDNIESDYVSVHFDLPFDKPLRDGNIYLFGAISDWQLKQENLMKYNYSTKSYQTKIYAKQGFYNYQYVIVNDGSRVLDHGLIEGNHYEAENDYVILIYGRQAVNGYDELIGMKRLNSRRLK
ncbi:MAG: DUF5103 domain-containing protein [Bacteroidetes bacterium]|nr:DUF5103 domain-containing protein [Bacteroidota bacterium]